jgi:hypothetical protein
VCSPVFRLLLTSSLDGGSMFLWNIGGPLPDNTTLLPRRRHSSYSPVWEPQVQHRNAVFRKWGFLQRSLPLWSNENMILLRPQFYLYLFKCLQIQMPFLDELQPFLLLYDGAMNSLHIKKGYKITNEFPGHLLRYVHVWQWTIRINRSSGRNTVAEAY